MKKPILILILVACIIAGCKVDEAGFPKVSTNTLLVGTWYIKAAINNQPGYPADTVTSFTSKDYFMFNSDNTVKLSYSFPDTSATTRYSYTNSTSGQQVVVGGSTDNTIYTIDKLTTDSLIMSWTITVTFGSLTTSIPSNYKLAHK